MGHFYIDDPEPVPFYEVSYADPSRGMRKTTLADARKVGAFPSPNTIMSVLAKPGLETWKRDKWGEAIQVALENSIDPVSGYVCLSWDEIVNNAKTIYATAMDEAPSAGTFIHAAIENAILERMGCEKRHLEQDVDARIVRAVIDWLDDYRFTPVEVEKVFTNPSLGIGGKLDLLALRAYGQVQRLTFLDWKTIDTVDGEMRGDYWKDKTPLLAAYAVGLSLTAQTASVTVGTFFNEVDCCNVFISRNEPGFVQARMYTWNEMIFGWKKFQLAYELWCLENNYDPRRTQ